MDPLTLALMAGSVLSNVGGGLSANHNAQENLMQTALNNYQQDRFSKAGATDALGNTNRYDEALNQWISQLSPTQQRIADAGQHEQLANLLQDAPRNRIMRENAYERSKQGADAYNDEFANYRFNRPQGEGSIDNELLGLMARARGSNGQGTTSNSTLRNGGKVAVVRAGNPNGGNGSVDDIAQLMLQARSGGLNEKGQRDNQFEQTGRSRLGTFGAVANGGAPAQINMSNASSGLQSQQERMMAARAQALENVNRNSQSAYTNLDKVQLQASKNLAGSFTSKPWQPGKSTPTKAGSTSSTDEYGNPLNLNAGGSYPSTDSFDSAFSLY